MIEIASWRRRRMIEIEKYLTESIDNSVINKIRKMTEKNDHIEAYIEGSKLLKNKKLEKIFTGIKMIMEAEQHLPHGISDYRYTVYKQMMDYAKSHLSPEDYNQFYKSF